MTRVKVCGITSIEDAMLCVTAGVWAIGFNFYSKSPRSISIIRAKEIVARLPSSVVKIGIFIEQDIKEMLSILENVGLDYAQVYTDVGVPEHLKSQFILSLRPSKLSDFHNIDKRYSNILIDAPMGEDCLYGGTGRQADWDIARSLSAEFRLILAGGLNCENIKQAIRHVQPYAVDLASGLESAPGIKQPSLLKALMQNIQEVEDEKCVHR